MKDSGMTHLVVLGLDNRDDAEWFVELAADLARQDLLQLDDVAYAYQSDDGKVQVRQTLNPTTAGPTSGALWGNLIGLIALNPLAGLVVGTGTGAVAKRLTDVGITDIAIKQIGAELEYSRAAVFLLVRSAHVGGVIEALKPYGPSIIQVGLNRDRGDQLVKALQA
jgi:uncharacterized membrane protein